MTPEGIQRGADLLLKDRVVEFDRLRDVVQGEIRLLKIRVDAAQRRESDVLGVPLMEIADGMSPGPARRRQHDQSGVEVVPVEREGTMCQRRLQQTPSEKARELA